MMHARNCARLTLLATAAALSLLTAHAQAAPAGPLASVVVSPSQPQIHVLGHSQHTLASAEFAELRGEYRLSSGGSLVLGGARHRPVVELNDMAPVALLPVAPNHLVSADGRMQLLFRTEANGVVSGLTLQLAPGQF